MSKLHRVLLAVILMLGLVSLPGLSQAGEIDILVEKLVEKGVLTYGEAQQILTETKEEVRKDLAKGELDTLPSWIQKIKPKGDIRIRFQNEDKTGAVDRTRGRVRFRWGFTAKPLDNTEVGLRIASGSAEQTSTNQTFEEAFQSKSIWLDQAYIKWAPFSRHDFSLIGGKMGNPFYRAQKADLVWDGDVNPEGGAFTYSLPLEDVTGISGMQSFLTAGFFPMGDEESSSDQDESSLVGTQAGLSWKMAGGGSAKFAVAYYDFLNVKGKHPTNDISDAYNPDTNSQDGSGNLIYDYNLVDINAEAKLPWKLNLLGTELPITLYSEIVNNIADNVRYDTAWLTGIKLGSAKKKGSWQFGYNYREIEQDAVLDIFPDSDFSGGGTNAKGHKLQYKYALTDVSTIGVTYLKTKQDRGAKDHHDTVQVDWATKF